MNGNDPANIQGHVIICGLHNRGYRILQQLLEAHLQVVVIDNTPDPRFAELAGQDYVPILYWDSRTEHALLEAGVARAIALIAVTENDLHNLETILVAQKLSPNLRTVASFNNQTIGEQLTRAIPKATALSTPKLAAPTFVTSSLPSQILHFFKLEQRELVVAFDRASRDGTLRELYGFLTPIMRQTKIENSPQAEQGYTALPREEIKLEKCPPPNVALKQGDLITLIGLEQELVQQPEVSLNAQQLADARRGRKISATSSRKGERLGIKGFFSGLWRDVDRPLRRVLAFLGAVLLLSTVFFLIFAEDKNPIDAFYLVLRVIGSNGEFDKEPNKIWLEIFSAVLIVVGTALLAIVYGYVTNFIVTSRLTQALGQQKATTMKNHVVLVGLGAVGYEVLRSLVKEKGQKVAVLEKDENNRYIALARNMGVPVVHADARVAESLDLVNIKEATCLTIVTNDDLANLETALNARARVTNRQLRIVMRLFDPDLAEKAERVFNISIARSTSALAAPYFIAAALNFEAITSFYVDRIPFFVAKISIKAGSVLEGLKVRDVYTRAKVLVLAYWGAVEQRTNNLDGLIEVRPTLEPILHPDSESLLKRGDIIYCVGPGENLLSVYQLNQPMPASTKSE